MLAAIALVAGIILTGCLKEDRDNTPIPAPEGKFNGKLVVIKRKHVTGAEYRFDTVKTDIKLTMKVDSGYQVTDTTGTHAPSRGTYAYNYYYIQFTDKTLPDTSKKRHLNGTYQYWYDGTLLKIGAANDTIKVVYDLKKTAN
ncbi:hypothetical protein DJ568_01045 [Mucilaginibacter hurinus]|uniref:Uncharacterized protein n=2 Tax=Mucilaginibacter hurinus TaxID=2201324 RepID=A0A367GTS4_9SPHI|nr:hypothetical protein DJ568_01045 [Mucilaginibacter hurinus]